MLQVMMISFSQHMTMNPRIEVDGDSCGAPQLRIKYNDSMADAAADLGPADEIATVFTSFQKYLYQKTA